MQKWLYGTTALVTAGALAGAAATPASAEAERVHYELGGYYQQLFGITDTDGTDTASAPAVGGTLLGTARNDGDFTTHQNAEIYFKIRGQLDNGLKIGGRLELEGQSDGDRMDQHFLVLEGGFGSFRLGAINSGRYSYGWTTNGPNVGFPINSGWADTIVTPGTRTGFRFRSVGRSTQIDMSNDGPKVTYFTPRFNGFQATASWTPVADNVGGTIGTAGTGAGGSPDFGGNVADEAIDYTNAIDIGVHYSGKFDNVGVTAQAGLGFAENHDPADAAALDDPFLWNGGVKVAWGGFSMAAEFAVVEEPMCLFNAACAYSNEGTAYNIGLGYNTGPWGFSVTYFRGEEEAQVAVAGDDENEFWTAGVSYTLGAGVRTSLAYAHVDFGAETVGDDTDADALMWVIWLSL